MPKVCSVMPEALAKARERAKPRAPAPPCHPGEQATKETPRLCKQPAFTPATQVRPVAKEEGRSRCGAQRVSFDEASHPSPRDSFPLAGEARNARE